MKINLFLLLFILFIFTRCNFLSDPIRVGVDNRENSQFLKVAKELGYLGNNFEIVEYKNKKDSLESFYMGKIDVIYSSVFDSVFFNNRGEKGQIFLLTSSSEKTKSLFVRNKTTSLKNKIIAMEADAKGCTEFLKYLKKSGLEEKDVEIVFKDRKEANEDFYKGNVDALYFSEPFDEKLLKKGRTIKESENIEESKETLVANKEIIYQNKRELRELVDAWYKVLYIKLIEPKKYIELTKDIAFESNDKYRKNYFFKDDNKKLLMNNEIENFLNKEGNKMNTILEAKELYTREIIK